MIACSFLHVLLKYYFRLFFNQTHNSTKINKFSWKGGNNSTKHNILKAFQNKDQISNGQTKEKKELERYLARFINLIFLLEIKFRNITFSAEKLKK